MKPLPVEAVTNRLRRHRLIQDRWTSLRRLGYRKPRQLGSLQDSMTDMAPDPEATGAAPFDQREGTAVVSVCTYNHAHYARTLFDSIRRFHPTLSLVLVVADAERTGFPDVPGVRLVSPREFGAVDFPYAALKYSASDLCCALKPLALRWLMATSRVRSLLYLDADMCVYAPLDRLLAAAAQHRAVVVPHVREPLPNPERFWERPSLGDLAYAGVLNAGVFALSADDAALRFLDTWSRLVTGPGAFMPTLGGQWEQNSFNWITAFLDGVHVFRDPAYNVAYWNLHDRSLRDKTLDHDMPRWTVDGEPLVSFHFSGFSLDEPLSLSRHDRRYSLFHMPSVATLVNDYAARLRQQGADTYGRVEYGFSRFSDGTPIDRRMRQIFQEEEAFMRREDDPWSVDGQLAYCEALWSPVPHRGSLLPVLLQSIYRDRPDLQAAWRDGDMNPEPLMHWLVCHGIHEYGYVTLYDRFRQVVAVPAAVEAQARACGRHMGAGDLPAPLTADRQKLIAAVRGEVSSADLGRLVTYDGETPFISRIRFVRAVYARRRDLRERFPDVFFQDAPGFAQWMSAYGAFEDLTSEEFVAAFRRCAGGQSLARIFSYLNRSAELVAAWPMALVGDRAGDFARVLLSVLRHGLEYDLDDVEMYLWMMELAPWSGCELALELLPHLAAKPSSRLPEGFRPMLQRFVETDGRFAATLRELEERARTPEAAAEIDRIRAWERITSQPTRATDYLRARRVFSAGSPEREAPPRTDSPAPAAQSDEPAAGINIFGFFKSPVGLGEMSRGLSLACHRIGVPTSHNVLGNIVMDEQLAPADFIRRFRHDYPRNLFVSYPHLDTVILHQYPVWMTAGRENIVYLAWEQRDGSHYWREVFEGFDQVWALSSFAAESLERCLGRPVHAVPCVMDLDTLPDRGTKAAYGLDPDATVVLYVFDANSSIERKNPEGALRAFEAAFDARDDVQLCIKVSNFARLEHRERLRSFLRRAARLGSRVKILTEQLSRHDTLRLISAVDCYMSLHRSEGFGYTCAEAMAYGVPVIATRYSGNLDFMDDASAYLVDAREVEVERAEGPFQRGSVWAEPRLDAAVEALRAVRHRPNEARERGARGQALIRARLSPSAVGARMAALLGADRTPAARPPSDDTSADRARVMGTLASPSRVQSS